MPPRKSRMIFGLGINHDSGIWFLSCFNDAFGSVPVSAIVNKWKMKGANCVLGKLGTECVN